MLIIRNYYTVSQKFVRYIVKSSQYHIHKLLNPFLRDKVSCSVKLSIVFLIIRGSLALGLVGIVLRQSNVYSWVLTVAINHLWSVVSLTMGGYVGTFPHAVTEMSRCQGNLELCSCCMDCALYTSQSGSPVVLTGKHSHVAWGRGLKCWFVMFCFPDLP
jgi:hypothetical protein